MEKRKCLVTAVQLAHENGNNQSNVEFCLVFIKNVTEINGLICMHVEAVTG